MDKAKEKGFTTIEESKDEVNRLRETVFDPQKIEAMILKNHTEANIVQIASYIQTEGTITFAHHIKNRAWVPMVGVTMGIEEPIEHTSRLVKASKRRGVTGRAWVWTLEWRKALSLLKTVEPYLMADKREGARYVLNIGKVIPDTEYRSMYHGIIGRAIRPIFLYPEYVNFPVKYAIVVHKGDELPRPLKRAFPIKYTSDGRPILWHEGMVKDP